MELLPLDATSKTSRSLATCVWSAMVGERYCGCSCFFIRGAFILSISNRVCLRVSRLRNCYFSVTQKSATVV
jgi:hypothetical protein